VIVNNGSLDELQAKALTQVDRFIRARRPSK
jgi:hypothetical protein